MEKIGFEIPGKPGVFKIEARQLGLFMPHRYPMVLLEEVAECSMVDKTITGTKKIRFEDPYVQAHFPGDSFMPASFIVESMAQTAGCLMNLIFFYQPGRQIWDVGVAEFCQMEQPPVNVLAEARIKQRDLAMAGETLSLHAKITLQRKEIFAFHTQAKVGSRLIAEGEILLAHPPYMPKIQPQESPSEALHVAR